MADFFADKQLMSKNGLVSAEKVLRNKKVVAIYFSAHWCPPCRLFTPVLKDFYEEIMETAGEELAIVFVSADRSESEMESYFKQDHGKWFAIQFDDEVAEMLKKNCSLTGIPKLAIVTKKGEMIYGDARSDVQNLNPRKAYKKWLALSK